MVNLSGKLNKGVVNFLVLVSFLAIIIGIIFFVKKNMNQYQKEQENPPVLYVLNEDGTKQEMLPIEYRWTYNGETKTYAMEEDFKTMEYPGEYIIMQKPNDHRDLVTNENYKIYGSWHENYEVTVEDVIGTGGRRK